MAYRFKARSATPGEYNFSAGTLGFAPAVSAVLTSAHIGDGTAGTYHAPDAAEVISTAVFGPASGTAGTYDVSNVSAGNIKKDVSIGGVTGTYDPMAAAVFPAEANVSDVETAYGPTGAEYAGSLDVDAMEAAAYASGYDAGEIDGAAAQYTTDAAAVEAVKAGIRTTVTVLGVTGTLDLSLYTLISGVVAAQYVLVGHDNYTGGDAGTFDESARNTDPGEANVVDGVTYKILNVAKEGTYAGGGGYTYGDNDPDYVLTTADGAGNYVPIADSDTVDGGVVYGVGEEGTGVNATTLGTILDARGITTANKAQTGDAYIRLGAPAGASIAADIATVDGVADAIKLKTDGLNFTGTDVKATLDGEEVTPTAASKTGYKLASDGLDSVVIETGLNARQALSVIAASAAGVLDGAATEEITMAAAGVPATNRITATVDENGNRSAVTLSPPT